MTCFDLHRCHGNSVSELLNTVLVFTIPTNQSNAKESVAVRTEISSQYSPDLLQDYSFSSSSAPQHLTLLPLIQDLLIIFLSPGSNLPMSRLKKFSLNRFRPFDQPTTIPIHHCVLLVWMRAAVFVWRVVLPVIILRGTISKELCFIPLPLANILFRLKSMRYKSAMLLHPLEELVAVFVLVIPA